MNIVFSKTIKKFERQPQSLFLIDGLGALLSAFLLGVVLVRLEAVFGIPPSALYFLAAWPILFSIYDYYCYRKDPDKLGVYLRGIAVMNLLYCCLSIGLACYHQDVIALFGWMFFILEVAIVITLSLLELRVAKELTQKVI
ncbi:MAG: hypothetical protein HKN76_20500 [Saprospiraceae bacterium]|nr:hypothetical protein [Saprospiraceae bacterium]